jgi:hypothetical protein
MASPSDACDGTPFGFKHGPAGWSGWSVRPRRTSESERRLGRWDTWRHVSDWDRPLLMCDGTPLGSALGRQAHTAPQTWICVPHAPRPRLRPARIVPAPPEPPHSRRGTVGGAAPPSGSRISADGAATESGSKPAGRS